MAAPAPKPVAPAFAKMQESVMRTVRVPSVIARNPAAVYIAAAVPLRVVIRNIGAANVFLAFTFAGALASTGLPGTDSMILPPTAERVLILAPNQTLYATSVIEGRVTLTASDALPIL